MGHSTLWGSLVPYGWQRYGADTMVLMLWVWCHAAASMGLALWGWLCGADAVGLAPWVSTMGLVLWG